MTTYKVLLQSLYNGTNKREFQKINNQDQLSNIIGAHIVNSENPESGLPEMLNYCLSHVTFKVKFAKDMSTFLKSGYALGNFRKPLCIYMNILDPYLPIL